MSARSRAWVSRWTWIERLIKHDPKALDLLDRATVGPQGAHRYIVTVSEPTRGHARQYALRRLRKDRPDLHARVLAGEMKPHRALVAARLATMKQGEKKADTPMAYLNRKRPSF